MNFSTDIFLKKLEHQDQITSFNCGVPDLNEFLLDDAINYYNHLMAVTYLVMLKSNENKIISYFSLSNDNLSDKGFEDWIHIRRMLNKNISNRKRRKDYPSVKIGRFAVCKEFLNNGLGTFLMDFLKSWFTINNKTGCRFIIVDSKNNSNAINFYSKNGFKFLTIHDEKDPTRLMYYDLMNY